MERHGTRITLVGLTHPFRGGIAHYTTMLYKALEKTQHVSLLNFSRQYPACLFPGTSQFDQSAVVFDVPNDRNLDAVNPWSWWCAFLRLKRWKARVVVLQWWHPFFGPCLGTIGYLLRLFTRQKVVFICHNVLPHERHRLDKLLTRYALASAHRLLVHTEHERSQVSQLLPRADVVCHPHPSYTQFHLCGLSQDEARQQLSITGNVLLFFGYVRPYKGLAYLLRALPQVLQERKVTLVIAGEFYEPKPPYEDLIHALKLDAHVRVIDRYIPNEEVERYFAACDLVICPYVSGSQSGIVQIAYSFQKPVICTRVGGLADAVMDGQTGFLVHPANPSDLARGILAFYQAASRIDFSHNILALTQRFSWQSLVRTILHD